jgi:predicted N-formylglutamate amidohydrolase
VPPVETILLTCEHAGKRVPAEYRRYFAAEADRLDGHAAYDPGAFAFARQLARRLGAPLHAHHVTRQLVDVNRSIGHRSLFSASLATATPEERRRILARHYLPHRQRVERRLARDLAGGRTVVHIGVHSFTPELDGEVRNADIGLLYDPQRRREGAFCRRWQKLLRDTAPAVRVRRNYPYLGAADGLTTHLRRRFGHRYLGIELELNQERLLAREPERALLFEAVASTLSHLLRPERRAG